MTVAEQAHPNSENAPTRGKPASVTIVVNGTDVTLTYDWTDTPQAFRDQIGGMPPFPIAFIEESLAALDRAVTG